MSAKAQNKRFPVVSAAMYVLVLVGTAAVFVPSLMQLAA
jgi:hypothetical protein